MKTMSKTRPNRLLRSLIGVSLGIHVIIFIHIAGIYRSNALTCIELTIQDVSKPPARSIPKPRHRPKTPPHPQDVKRLKVSQQQIPYFKPIKMESIELPDSPVERISIPDIPNMPDMKIAEWGPGDSGQASDDYITSQKYLEMVKTKIEGLKKYPDMARNRYIEGSVTVRFVITPDGGVKTVELIKTSRHKILDTAALKAVKEAAPFPKPPKRFFNGEIRLELTIVFKLT